MIIPNKKLKIGFEMPVFGFGTWRVGGGRERELDNDDEADIAAIRGAIDRGITHIDTAEVYASGYTEQLIAKALQGYDRSKIFLASKAYPNFDNDGIRKSCEESLKRLETDYLDLYLIHKYISDFPLKYAMRVLDKLVDEGTIKSIGVSNFSKERLEEAQSYSSNKIVCNQVHYNLVYREPERTGLLAYCQSNDIFLVAWRPLRNMSEEGIPEILNEMSGKYHKTQAQIAINWLISQSHVLTISKTRDLKHLDENLGAIGWEMDRADVERLRSEYPGQHDISDTIALG